MELTDAQKIKMEELMTGGMDAERAMLIATSPLENAADIVAGLSRPPQQQKRNSQEDQARIEALKTRYHDQVKMGDMQGAISTKHTLFKEFGQHVN